MYETLMRLEMVICSGEGTNIFTVSVLGREEGYTVKYGLTLRAIPRAQAIFSYIRILPGEYTDLYTP